MKLESKRLDIGELSQRVVSLYTTNQFCIMAHQYWPALQEGCDNKHNVQCFIKH